MKKILRQAQHPKAIVIGAGVAGIAAAIRLQVKGYAVTLLEKNEYPGGKLTSIQLGEYRFDAGPSVFTMPEHVVELFELAKKDPKDYFEYVRLKTSCNYFWNDGFRYSAPGNTKDFVESASKTFEIDKNKVQKYADRSAYKYRVTKSTFLENSVHKLKNFFSILFIKSYVHLLNIDVLKTLNKTNRTHFGNSKIVDVLNKFAHYNGSHADRASGAMTALAHLEIEDGVYLPKNGMHGITLSLVQLCKDLGVDIRYNQKVTEITKKENTVKGVKTETEELSCDVLICNSDVYFAHKNLLKTKKPPKALQQERSSSVVVFYWGIKKEFPELDVHNMFFSDDTLGEFDAIFDGTSLVDDPSIYLNKTCQVNKKDAPRGKENWYVMAITPSSPETIQEKEIKDFRKVVLNKLSKILNKDIASLIEEEDYLNPKRLEERTNSYKGAIFGTSSNSITSAFMRHSNFSSDYKNLYFVGGSAHPGGGIPLCLLSAKIATEDV